MNEKEESYAFITMDQTRDLYQHIVVMDQKECQPTVVADKSPNKYINIKQLLKNMKTMSSHKIVSYDWDLISSSSQITVEDIVKTPNLPWRMYQVSRNTNLDIREIIKYPGAGWRLYELSQRNDLTIETVVDGMENGIKWKWEILSGMFKVDIIYNHIHLPWVGGVISYDRDLTIELIVSKWSTSRHIEYNWRYLTEHNTLETIEKYKYLPWDQHVVYNKQYFNRQCISETTCKTIIIVSILALFIYIVVLYF